MKKRSFYGVWVAVALLMVWWSQAMGEVVWQQGAMTVEDEMSEEGGRIRIGKLKVIPALKVGGVYDDNIFLGNGYTDNPNNPGTTTNGKLTKPIESDYIMHVMPGLLLNYGLPEGRGSVNVGYEGDWAFYRDFTSQNWNNQRGLFDANYAAPAGLILGLKDVFNSGNDPYGDATQYALGWTKQRWNNDMNFKVGWDFFNRFKLLGYYDFYKQKYDDDRDYTQNWTTNRVGVGAEMRVLPKTWAFVRYYYQIQGFDSDLFGTTSENNADNKQNMVNVGLNWESGSKLGGELNFGWGWLSYDNTKDKYGNNYEDANTWVAGTSIDYRILPKTLLTFNLARAMRPTGADKREYYDDTQVGLNVIQDLPYKFSVLAGFIYGRNDYNTQVSPVSNSTEDRKDDNYNANIGLRYKIRPWLDANLGYRYMKKDSNDVTQSFTDNQVLLSLGAAY